jgi:hypothetical protein
MVTLRWLMAVTKLIFSELLPIYCSISSKLLGHLRWRHLLPWKFKEVYLASASSFLLHDMQVQSCIHLNSLDVENLPFVFTSHENYQFLPFVHY